MRVLFVCLGNICRSPMAEGLFSARAAAAGLRAEADSAGTGAWHAGEPPDRRAQAVMAAVGCDISGQRARKARRRDFDDFDLIVAMSREQLHALQAMRPPAARAEIRLMLDYAAGHEGRDVPDPYYEGGFDGVRDLIGTAVSGLIEALNAGAIGHGAHSAKSERQ